MHKLLFVGTALAALLAGCASQGSRESTSDPLATISIEKTSTLPAGDCAVNVTISNRVRDSNWDGVSYHVSLLDRAGKNAGRLMGAPRHPISYGQTLSDRGRVLGAKCEDIAGVELIYLGYYPKGSSQVHVHNNRVRASVK